MPLITGGGGGAGHDGADDDDDDYDGIPAGFSLPEHAFVCLARRSVN